jgi:hypothetical protein
MLPPPHLFFIIDSTDVRAYGACDSSSLPRHTSLRGGGRSEWVVVCHAKPSSRRGEPFGDNYHDYQSTDGQAEDEEKHRSCLHTSENSRTHEICGTWSSWVCPSSSTSCFSRY